MQNSSLNVTLLLENQENVADNLSATLFTKVSLSWSKSYPSVPSSRRGPHRPLFRFSAACKYLLLITEDMKALTGKLEDVLQNLLSHVLDYKFVF